MAGLLGFIAGIGVGVVCLRKGFSLGRAYPVRSGEGMALPLILVIGLSCCWPSPPCCVFPKRAPAHSTPSGWCL